MFTVADAGCTCIEIVSLLFEIKFETVGLIFACILRQLGGWDAAIHRAKPGNKGKLHRTARTATAPNILGTVASGKINGYFNGKSFRQV